MCHVENCLDLTPNGQCTIQLFVYKNDYFFSAPGEGVEDVVRQTCQEISLPGPARIILPRQKTLFRPFTGHDHFWATQNG